MRLLIVTFSLLAAALAGCAGSPDQAASLELSPPDFACVLDGCAAPVAGFGGSEPWGAINPADPSHWVVMGNGLHDGALGHSWQAVYQSHDGGANWTRSTPPGGPNDGPGPLQNYGFAADSMVAFHPDGTLLMAALVGQPVSGGCTQTALPCLFAPGVPQDIDLALWRSVDGGATFEARLVHDSDGAIAFSPAARPQVGTWTDKEFLVVDQETGRAYLAWNDISQTGLALMMMTSDDAGATWSEPRVLSQRGYGANVAALGGTVLLAYKNGWNGTYDLMRSVDGGESWSQPIQMGEMPGQQWQPSVPQLWRLDGQLRAGFARAEGAGNEQVVLDLSPDGGATWNRTVVLHDEATGDERNIAFAVDPATGRGVVSYYQGTYDELHVLAAPFDDGSMGAPRQISTQPVHGDSTLEYYASAWLGDQGFLAWAGPDEFGRTALHTAALVAS